MKVFNNLTEYNRYLNLSTPLHSLMDSRVCKQAIPNFPQASGEIQVNLFKIALKKKFTGEIKYGTQQYNTEAGLMLFSEPGQVVSWDALTFWDGYAFVFHPSLIKKHPVAHKVSRYRYFSYEVSDALFMTPEEEEIITWLFTKIHVELMHKKEQANTEVILSLLQVILTYAEMYYERQYSEKAALQQTVAARVKLVLQNYYNNLSQPVKSVPTVSSIAAELNVSPDYLTEMVRKETGKSTMNLLQAYVMEQAEILLLQTDLNISDVAFRLGFESASYFSKLFKKIKGMSPGDVRKPGIVK